MILKQQSNVLNFREKLNISLRGHEFTLEHKRLSCPARVHFLVVFFRYGKNYLMSSLAMSVRPSSVEITLERGFDRSA